MSEADKFEKIRKLVNWIAIIGAILLLITLTVLKLYNLAWKFAITIILLIIFLYIPRIKPNQRDIENIEKGIEFRKLKLQQNQIYSTTLISLGFGMTITGVATLPNNLDSYMSNYMVWIGLVMMSLGALIEAKLVKPRQDLLERHYSSFKQEQKLK